MNIYYIFWVWWNSSKWNAKRNRTTTLDNRNQKLSIKNAHTQCSERKMNELIHSIKNKAHDETAVIKWSSSWLFVFLVWLSLFLSFLFVRLFGWPSKMHLSKPQANNSYHNCANEKMQDPKLTPSMLIWDMKWNRLCARMIPVFIFFDYHAMLRTELVVCLVFSVFLFHFLLNQKLT